LAKRRNLTKDDLEDVSIYEEITQKKTQIPNKVRLLDIPIQVKCLNEKQKDLKKAIEEKQVVITTGPAGTGKTYVSLLTALHILKTEPQYSRLVLVKSLQTIKGEDIGYLPGTLEEKMTPYMYSFTGNLDKIFKSPYITKALSDQGVIEVFPIAFVRGVTIDNAIVVIDEAQNIDMHTFRTIITRIGKSCKMVFLGDVDQIDRKNKGESCLARVATLFKGAEYAESVIFTDEESVRNPIIPKLLELLKGEE
jgi:phosphate starvation-inducible protein PhoH and related proteins